MLNKENKLYIIRKVTCILCIIVLYYSCDNDNSNIIGPYKVHNKLHYYQPKVECIKPPRDSFQEKDYLSNLSVPCKRSFDLSSCKVKDIIELANGLRTEYVSKSKNTKKIHSFLDTDRFDFFTNSISKKSDINYCVYDRIYFDKSDEIYKIHKVSKSVMHPDLEIYPFFYNEFTICYCRGNVTCNDTKRGYIGNMNYDAANCFLFFDKVNNLILCFGPECSGRGYWNPNPIFHSRIYILDNTLYPICLMSFDYGDLYGECETGYIPLSLYRLDYFKNTRYVDKYTELNYSKLNKGMLLYNNLRYKTLVEFINIMKKNMNVLYLKENMNWVYSIHSWNQSCFPPTPEWCE